ncbi:hypothetical protein PMAYCL1PPCAC_01008, partial [Pristionchus mayeri]
VQHVRGIMLYGPPGTGKTLIALQISAIIGATEETIRVVNSSDILDMYVGNSERNMAALFTAAEIDQNRLVASDRIHVIIFDEIDALCRHRGQ